MSLLSTSNKRRERHGGSHGEVWESHFEYLKPQLGDCSLSYGAALKPRPFIDSLYKKPVADLDELRQKVTKFMQLKELHVI